MKFRNTISQNVLHFSKFSKKGYAIFCSLGNTVHISRLSVDICDKAILKDSDVISEPVTGVNLSSLKESDDDEGESEISFNLLQQIQPAVINSCIESRHCPESKLHIKLNNQYYSLNSNGFKPFVFV